jgi:hypothetical protein
MRPQGMGLDKDEPKKIFIFNVAEMLLKELELCRLVSQFFMPTHGAKADLG